MCGIVGVISSLNNAELKTIIDTSFAYIESRGPDGHGVWKTRTSDAVVIFGHTRLAIIDLSDHAYQPMQDSSCEWVITYNGEIYNYLELRSELACLGWSFHSHSDAEVLLKAWVQWGIDALPRLNGMFSFSVCNKKTGETWLVRDRFGVKPLLWGRLPSGGIFFSSSVAAVAQVIDAPVDTAYCALGLKCKAFESMDAGAPFEGVESIPPGGWLKIGIHDSHIVLQSGYWYSLAGAVALKLAEISSRSSNELVEQCQHTLQDAVKIRLRSDAPLAVSLSGGLDSSTVAALAVQRMDSLHGFTYGAADAPKSEGPIVERFAQQSGIRPHFIWPKFNAAELDSLLERTLTWQEAPFPGLSVMAQNEVFRVVRESGFKVLLGGQGGDEIFAGYRKFFLVALRHATLQRDMREALRLVYSLGLMLLSEAQSLRLYWQAFSRYRNREDFTFRLLNWPAPTADLWGGSATTLTSRQLDDIQRWSIPTLLRYEDRNSMGHGIETRLPFMDYRLVELALALPVRMKIAQGFGKWVVRQIAKDVVPDFIRLNRRKRGFDVTQSWISTGVGASLRSRIRDNGTVLAPYLRNGSDLDKLLSNERLSYDRNILDEALMLAWLAKPIRLRTAGLYKK